MNRERRELLDIIRSLSWWQKLEQLLAVLIFCNGLYLVGGTLWLIWNGPSWLLMVALLEVALIGLLVTLRHAERL